MRVSEIGRESRTECVTVNCMCPCISPSEQGFSPRMVLGMSFMFMSAFLWMLWSIGAQFPITKQHKDHPFRTCLAGSCLFLFSSLQCAVCSMILCACGAVWLLSGVSVRCVW